jgi:hypothetical protein
MGHVEGGTYFTSHTLISIKEGKYFCPFSVFR